MTADDGSETVVIRRLIPVPRERVFAAWLEPASLAVWMCPGPVVSASAEVDARVGGRFRIVMKHPNGDADHWGEYLAIDPPSKLSFSWMSQATDRQPTIVLVEFFDRGGDTEIVLTHRRLPPPQTEPHRKGWSDIVQKLGATLASGSRA
ncbi:MAG TPA: SRPBCC domain-containing protein [Vicinamibacterales bacterium]|nr:SRPBCC domain-containing protein [Vicinamibacterales bacterium]